MNGGEVKSVFCVYVCPRVAQITPVERGIPAGIQRRDFLTLVVISFRVFFVSTSIVTLDRSSSASREEARLHWEVCTMMPGSVTFKALCT